MEYDPLTEEAIRIDEASQGLLDLGSKPELTCHTSATEYAKFALGDRADEVLDRLGTARKLYESIPPEKQCNAVLKNKPKTSCWLCGKRLFPKEEGPNNPKRTVCEHIFPISLAVFFLDLHRKENPSVVSEGAIQEEYDWAHVYCNSVKNSTPFVTEQFNEDGKIEKWVVYDAGIRDMLSKIAVGAKSRGFPEYYIYDENWQDRQFKSIQGKINKILTTEINTQDTPILTYMLGLLKCADPERLHKFGKLAMEGKPLPLKRSRSILSDNNTTKRNKLGGKRTRKNKHGPF